MIKNKYDLSQPVQMIGMAQVLKKHVTDQRLYTNISGKNYVQVEGWQFAGGLMGLYPRIKSVENLSNGNEIKWKTDVEVVRIADDKVVGQGFALCSNKEMKKKSFDEYAILSMSQTRAIGKAYRNLIGWVMKMSGYEATPSEEMANMGGVVNTPPATKPPVNTTSSKPAPTKTSPLAPEPPKGKTPPFECMNCAEIISEAEAKFSKRIYSKPLCRNCQAKAKK